MSDEVIRRAQDLAREIMQRLARDGGSRVLDHGWNAEGTGDSVVAQVLKAMGVRQGDRRDIEWAVTLGVRSVIADAVASGLAVPGRADQVADWNSRNLTFQFTPTGRRVLGEGAVVLHDAGSLRAALTTACADGLLAVEDHEIELLAEAQHCWQNSCFRAAAVLIGLANEARCLALVNAMVAVLPNPTSQPAIQDLTAARDANKLFTARWRPALRLLDGCRKALRQAGHGQSWWEPWEGVPGTLSTLGEAVRLTRNTAAHDPHQTFGRHDVALLLAAMPHQIALVSSLTAFFAAVPAGVALPSL